MIYFEFPEKGKKRGGGGGEEVESRGLDQVVAGCSLPNLFW